MQTEARAKSFKAFKANQDEILSMFQSDEKIVNDQKIQGIITTLNNVEDLSSLLELDDVKDELHSLEKLFLTQKRVITDLLACYKVMDNKSSRKHDRAVGWLNDTLRTVDKYSRAVKDLSNDCKRAEESVCSSRSNSISDGYLIFLCCSSKLFLT